MRKQSLVAALTFGLTGALSAAGSFLYGGSLDVEATGQAALAGACAALTGSLCWRWIALNGGNSPSRARGVWVGALVGLLAHLPYWYSLILVNWAFGEPSVLGDAIDPVTGLWAAPVYSLMSWLMAGWITVPVGAATGLFLATGMHGRHESTLR